MAIPFTAHAFRVEGVVGAGILCAMLVMVTQHEANAVQEGGVGSEGFFKATRDAAPEVLSSMQEVVQGQWEGCDTHSDLSPHSTVRIQVTREEMLTCMANADMEGANQVCVVLDATSRAAGTILSLCKQKGGYLEDETPASVVAEGVADVVMKAHKHDIPVHLLALCCESRHLVQEVKKALHGRAQKSGMEAKKLLARVTAIYTVEEFPSGCIGFAMAAYSQELMDPTLGAAYRATELYTKIWGDENFKSGVEDVAEKYGKSKLPYWKRLRLLRLDAPMMD